jgi:Rrf2 family iron-sulfur cluster assembly transcriptional regulator
MRLTRSVSYAVSVLLNVERRSARQSLTAAEISRDCQFPPRFLYRILRRLVDSGLLTGVSGPGGGYRLARSARRITLLEIVEAVEGPQKPTTLEPVCRTHRRSIDLINRLCAQNAKQFQDSLRGVTLATLDRGGVPPKKTARRSVKKRPKRTPR